MTIDSVKIYLSGAMGGLSVPEQKYWRNQVKTAIMSQLDISGTMKMPVFHSPPDYYPYVKDINYSERKSEREVMEFDLYQVRHSDLIIVNFDHPNSIGTAMELMLAKEYHIPVVGLNAEGHELHSWLSECCIRICDSMNELVTHVVDFYLR